MGEVAHNQIACVAGRICEQASANSHQLRRLVIKIKNMFLNDKIKCVLETNYCPLLSFCIPY